MLAEIPVEEFAASLDVVAGDVLDAGDVRRPPVDMLRLARRMGITLAWDDHQQVRGRYVRLNTGGDPAPTILLRPEPRPERRQWVVAHEIGEHAAHRVFAALAVDPRELGGHGREEVANLLAGRLLLPTPWFAADGAECGWDLAVLKARYSTASHELIARRMLEQSPPVIITIFDQGRASLRRSNVPGRVPPLASVESDCWRRVHEHGRAERADEDRLHCGAWPVHEPGWKREILRTGLDIDLF